MAALAVRVTVVHSEPFASAAIERAVARKVPRGVAWRQERVSALGAEEMLRVVCALSETFRLTQCDEVLVRNRSLAVITSRSEFLETISWGRRNFGRVTYLVVVERAIDPSFVLKHGQILQQLITSSTAEASRMPVCTHSVH